MRIFLLLLAAAGALSVRAQQKPLDHSVYDGWTSVGERKISNDGRYVAYAINPQEGDGTLVIESSDQTYRLTVPRGYDAEFSNDNRYLVFRIKPLFSDTREAKIKKKRPEDMPKDSLGLVQLGKDSITRIARVKSYKMPEKGNGLWLAYLLEKEPPAANKSAKPDSLAQLQKLSHLADSLARVADSLRHKVSEARQLGLTVLKPAAGRPAAKKTEPVEEGTRLVLMNLGTGSSLSFLLVKDYYFSDSGNVLLLETSANNKDSLSQAAVLWIDPASGQADTIMRGFNDARNYAFDAGGRQLAFVAERDSAKKALQKFYRLWYFTPTLDSAVLRADRSSTGVPDGYTISPDYSNRFSKDGHKLFFGLAPILRPKDTSLVDFETAQLDIWHYNDDYLQPQQLLQLPRELRKSYLAVLNGADGRVIPLGGPDAENVSLVNEGNADFVLATSTAGFRKELQWQGFSRQNAYIVSTRNGSRKIIKEKARAFFSASPEGRFVVWYDPAARHYFTYEVATGITRNISSAIKVPLWDELDDHPADPPAHGMATWTADDKRLLIYDRFDLWEVDPAGKAAPVNLTRSVGRSHSLELRYQPTDRDQRFIARGQTMLLRAFDTKSKYGGYYSLTYGDGAAPKPLCLNPKSYNALLKARNTDQYLVQVSDINASELYLSGNLQQFSRLTQTADQQKPYNWLTVELRKWKMFDGKEAEGLLFKPENFDPHKKYPVIFYFYERNSDGLYNYRAPAPSASTINIPYFASNGYLVFVPDIWYKNGEPGESAYNSVVSAARMMAKMPWVDSTKMAIQGQSWGGYQVAYLVTRTHMFAAAGAGAPVANMTSAYGGIRWGSGMNRQFQYERTQSRIGATLWERRDLYLKNSPLFAAPKVQTPLLIMHNDKDGAVPWYQGIEFFTALKRLGKKVWLLEYNGEDHNLVQRRNRKDLSIRLGQFFDYYLKGAKPAVWIAEGVPATLKGIDWGTELEGEKRSF